MTPCSRWSPRSWRTRSSPLTAWAEQHSTAARAGAAAQAARAFGREPAELPIVSQSLQPWDRPNLQLAIDAWLEDREFELFGLPPMHGYRAGLAELVRGGGPAFLGLGELTGLEHITVPLGEHESVTCVQSGLWLVAGDDGPVALMLRGQEMGEAEKLTFEAMAPERERAEHVIADLRRTMSERNVYRGRVLELQPRHFHDDEGAPLTVRTLPQVRREQIVLPEDVLERIERQTFGIARHAERLRASGRHLRRGLLLHGPPGVGKTLTAMYLAARMPERTVVILTGRALSVVQTCVDLATALQPAMVCSRTSTSWRWTGPTSPPTPSSSSCSTRWTASTRTTTCCSS